MPNVEGLATRLLVLLPLDGRRISHDDARILLERDAQAAIEKDTYFDVVRLLEQRGRVQRGRGPGGTIGLAGQVPEAGPGAPTSVSEAQLMPALQIYLERRFWRTLRLPEDAYWSAVDTSTGGPQNGQWRRGDFTGVAIQPLPVLNGNDVVLYTFELKVAGSGNVQAVHEAHAQTRGSHYGFLVWHVPDPDAVEARLREVESECHRIGVGLITFVDPQNLDSWVRRVMATRQSTNDLEIDDFLRTRLDMHEIRTIQQWMTS